MRCIRSDGRGKDDALRACAAAALCPGRRRGMRGGVGGRRGAAFVALRCISGRSAACAHRQPGPAQQFTGLARPWRDGAQPRGDEARNRALGQRFDTIACLQDALQGRRIRDRAGLGIDPERVVRQTWIIAAALMVIAGTLYGLDKSFKAFNYFQILLPVFAAAIVGGLGALTASLVVLALRVVASGSVQVDPYSLLGSTATTAVLTAALAPTWVRWTLREQERGRA